MSWFYTAWAWVRAARSRVKAARSAEERVGDEVRRVMKAHCRRKGQKIVFIHGKGEGVLRKAVLALLKKEYPACELQDASFREYGFGATLVTVH